jgi:hypothetical protein
MPRYVLRRSERANARFKIGRDGTREEVIAKYEHWHCDSLEGQALIPQIDELRSKDLVCWCAPAEREMRRLLRWLHTARRLTFICNWFGIRRSGSTS